MADCSEVSIRDSYLFGSDFRAADFSEASIRGSYLFGSDFRAADFSEVSILDSYLQDSDFRAADFSKAVIDDSHLQDSDFRAADFSKAVIRCSYLHMSDLRWIYLSDADLTNTNLIGANLRESTLDRANLTDTVLAYADLSNATLGHATLHNTNFTYADLSGAAYPDTILQSANLFGAIGCLANQVSVDTSDDKLQENEWTSASVIAMLREWQRQVEEALQNHQGDENSKEDRFRVLMQDIAREVAFGPEANVIELEQIFNQLLHDIPKLIAPTIDLLCNPLASVGLILYQASDRSIMIQAVPKERWKEQRERTFKYLVETQITPNSNYEMDTEYIADITTKYIEVVMRQIKIIQPELERKNNSDLSTLTLEIDQLINTVPKEKQSHFISGVQGSLEVIGLSLIMVNGEVKLNNLSDLFNFVGT